MYWWAKQIENDDVATSATSGITSILLRKGRTTNNRFKLQFTQIDSSVCNIRNQSDQIEYLQKNVLVTIDED